MSPEPKSLLFDRIGFAIKGATHTIFRENWRPIQRSNYIIILSYILILTMASDRVSIIKRVYGAGYIQSIITHREYSLRDSFHTAMFNGITNLHLDHLVHGHQSIWPIYGLIIKIT